MVGRAVAPVSPRRPTNDGDAICEVAQRPNIRSVPLKREEEQGAAAVFRARRVLIRQRTQTCNAMRGHLAGFGEVVPRGAASMRRLIAPLEDPESDLPHAGRAALQVLAEGLRHLDGQIGDSDA